MPLERPETGYVWQHVPLSQAVECVIVGEVHSWWAHWVGNRGGKQNRGIRCVRPESVACAWCAGGHVPRVRYVLPILVGTDLRLIELGRVQYTILSMMQESGGLVGRRIVVVREWAAKNAPIQVRPAGQERLSPEQVVCVEQFVSQLGRHELAIIRPPTPVDG